MRFKAILLFVVVLLGSWGLLQACSPPGSCYQDDDCSYGRKCLLTQCVECVLDSDCNAGDLCRQNKCFRGNDGQLLADASTQEHSPSDAHSPSEPGTTPDAVANPDTPKRDGTIPTDDLTPTEPPPPPDNNTAVCQASQTRPCYTGPGDKAGKGICKEGTQTCTAQGEWGPCQGDVPPSDAEVCGDNLDNNCNGDTDEGCECKAGTSRPCGLAIGECKKGTQTCSTEAQWGSCQGATQPQPETCDSKDNNCDGSIDEQWPKLGQTCYVGVGACRTKGRLICAPDGQKTTCDATAGSPKAETCNGIDDDCDGDIDEGLTQACYDGPSGTKDKGICRAGTQTCQSGQWSACKGQVQPESKEACDEKDNDCDGEVDEGCDCKPGETQDCGTDIGECKKGTQTCNQAGQWNPCQNATPPANELCDGKDNDCDGSIDESFSQKGKSCSVGTGECRNSGKYICNSDGSGTQCSASAGSPTSEKCNGKDDDCDGDIDENFSLGRACSVGTGECRRTGTTRCNSTGSSTTCSASAGSPTSEKCNGKDDDCDGSTDENFSNKGRSCAVGTGACRRTGTYVCNSTGSGTTCSASPGSPTSEKCNGIDDDCDGKIDDGVSNCCTPGEQRSCPGGTNTGACSAGTQTCSSTRSWGSCTGQVGPTSETCNGKDDDCDGSTDEGNPGGGGSCTTGLKGICSPGTKVCSGGKVICRQNKQPTTETCNDKDDDCDGSTDETFSRKGKSCTKGVGECQRSGTWVCNSGGTGTVCNATAGSPKAETCNNKDDDCDGTVDDGNPGGGQSCTTGLKGICGDGTTRCTNGTVSCQQKNTATTEKCNGLDDDCDGTVDEDNPGGGQSCVPDGGTCQYGNTYCGNGQIYCIPDFSKCPICNPQCIP